MPQYPGPGSKASLYCAQRPPNGLCASGVLPGAPASNRKAGNLFLSLAGVYFLAGFTYVCYSTETQTGVFGYLMALEMRAFGVASFHITAVSGAVLIVVLPILVMLAAIQKFFPGLHTAVAAHTQPQRATPIGPISWKRIFIVTGCLLAATAFIGLVLYANAARQDRTVYRVDLADSTAAFPKSAVFAELTAVPVRGYLVGYREEGTAINTVHIYAPLAGPGWRPGEPVRYFVHEAADVSSSNETPYVPEAFRQVLPAQFPGKIAGALPVIVAQKFKSRGLVIAPAYTLIDRTTSIGGAESASDRFAGSIIAGFVGIAVTFFVFIALALLRKQCRPAMRAAR